jgi:hypothetical protein
VKNNKKKSGSFIVEVTLGMWIIFSYPINTFDKSHNGNTVSLFADVNMKLYGSVGDDKRLFVLFLHPSRHPWSCIETSSFGGASGRVEPSS